MSWMSRNCLRGAVLVATVLLAGCALRRPAPQWFQLADGFTAPTLTESLRLTPRTFTVTEFTRACPEMRSVDRLESAYKAVELRPGESFPLAALSVVAFDADDRVMEGVPISLEVENGRSPALRVRSDDPDLLQGRIVAANPGRFRLRVHTLCGPEADVVIRGRVLGRPSAP